MIADNMQAAPQPAAPQAAPQGAPQGGDPVQRIVTAAVMLLNTDQVEQHIVSIIQGAQDPAQGIAQALVFLLRTLKEKSQGMPMQALGQASQQILVELMKMAESAHLIQVTPELLQQVIQEVKAALSPQGAPGAPAAPEQPVAPAQPQGV